jgi:hypothetical protein
MHVVFDAYLPFACVQLRFLEECKKMLERFSAFHHALHSDNPLSQLEAMTNVVKLLSIVEVFATPQER